MTGTCVSEDVTELRNLVTELRLDVDNLEVGPAGPAGPPGVGQDGSNGVDFFQVVNFLDTAIGTTEVPGTQRVGDRFISLTLISEASNGFVFSPNRALPNNTGVDTFFVFKFPELPIVSPGMTIRLMGINDADPFQLLAYDGISTISETEWKIGDYLVFTRNGPGSYRVVYRFESTLPDAPVSANDGLTTYERIALRMAAQNAQIALQG